jgi:hypothetical protein
MSRAVVLLVALCAFAPVGLAAQDTLAPVTIDSGKLVRMHTTHSIVIGRLTSRYQRTDAILHYCRYPGPPCLSIEDSAAMRTIPAATLLRFEVSQGSQWPRGALIGGVLGAVTGAYVATEIPCTKCSSKAEGVVLVGVFNGLLWGGIGAVIGSAFPRWSTRP